MKITLEPTTAEDCAAFFPEPAPFRIRGLTAKLDGKIIGIGGLTYRPDGTAIAFVECSEEQCKKYPKALHTASLRTIKEAQAAGVKRIIAKTDGSRDKAERYLQRLGFKHVGMVDGEKVYEWQAYSNLPR